MSSERWVLAAPGDFWSDCVAFMPDEGPVGSAASRPVGAAEVPLRSDEGALCWAVEPADGASRLMPVPCALAKPVPAISATAATDIIKRLVIYISSRVCIARGDNERKCVMFRKSGGSMNFVL
jgi:hypothetical protein